MAMICGMSGDLGLGTPIKGERALKIQRPIYRANRPIAERSYSGGKTMTFRLLIASIGIVTANTRTLRL